MDLFHAQKTAKGFKLPIIADNEEDVYNFDLQFTINNTSVKYINVATSTESDLNTSEIYGNAYQGDILIANSLANGIKSGTRIAVLELETSNSELKSEDFTTKIGLIHGKPANVEWRDQAPTGIVSGSEGLGISPNPSENGFIKLSGLVKSGISKVRIFGIDGSLQYDDIINNSNPIINVSHMGKGLYIINIQQNNDSTTMKLILR